VSGLYVARNEAAGRWMSSRASRFSSRDRASRKWTSSTSPGTAARSSKAPRGTKLPTQTLEEHPPGLPRDHQFRHAGLCPGPPRRAVSAPSTSH
jgi:hypothetical protein